MAQLARLTAGLALVQQGLDELDGHIRQELLACSALRKQAAVKRNETEQLASKVEEVSCCGGLGQNVVKIVQGLQQHYLQDMGCA
jgi:hypothetical protein